MNLDATKMHMRCDDEKLNATQLSIDATMMQLRGKLDATYMQLR